MISQLKSGKEADLFVVARGSSEYVAKVYRERRMRSFKNDAGYREGRRVRNTRAQRAINKNTRFGRDLSERAWHSAEVDALQRLEKAGARVPRMLAHHDRVLIMELICDASGRLAPQLAQVPLDPDQAEQMYDTILGQVILMLLNDLIHADLSPYNVLIGKQGPVIIDMPQCVSAAQNLQAAKLLERDVQAIAQHLGLIVPQIRELGKESWQLWLEYERGTLTPDFRPEPGRERGGEVGDLPGLVDFLRSTRDEVELERLAAEGDLDARALLRAAERRAARQERRRAELAAEAEEEAERAQAQTEQKAERKKPRKRGRRRSPSKRRRRGNTGSNPSGSQR